MFLERETLDRYIEMLNEYPLLYIHVTCPLKEILRREKECGSRKIEQSEHLPIEINPYDIYDLTVDMFRNTTDDCAIKSLSY